MRYLSMIFWVITITLKKGKFGFQNFLENFPKIRLFIIMGKTYIITEQQYELYQKGNDYYDGKTPVEGEIVWRALAKANDNLGEALRLVQMCIQYSNEYPGLEDQLIQISQDISCGSNNVIECGPDSSDIMGQINGILKEMGYIKRDNIQSYTIGQ
jgi:hypothetical protein